MTSKMGMTTIAKKSDTGGYDVRNGGKERVNSSSEDGVDGIEKMVR